MSEELKAFQPQYWSNTTEQWCNIQGYKDKEDGSKELVLATNKCEAQKKFKRWIRKRFHDHSGLERKDYNGYSYRMGEVEV
jgi:hypothetical protein